MDMPEFMKICVEHGLIFDEKDFEKDNHEACRFLLSHPLFAEPKVIAVFCDYMDDDDTVMSVYVPKSEIICSKDSREVLYGGHNRFSAEDLVSAIEQVKKLCDEELELQQKGNELTTKQLADYLQYALGNNAKIKLNCSIRELTQSPIGKSLDIQSV
jgi:hypothetical protein